VFTDGLQSILFKWFTSLVCFKKLLCHILVVSWIAVKAVESSFCT